MIQFTIMGNPATKKNHQQIFVNRKTNRPFITQSAPYKEYEKDAGKYLKPIGIDYPVNIKVIYYMKSRRLVDLSNLLSATNDILVKYGVLIDDNRNIIAGHDGSAVLYDKESPRAEITITPIEGYEMWSSKK